MVFLGNHFDLGAGLCLPLGYAGVKRLVLLTANELGLQGDPIEFSGR